MATLPIVGGVGTIRSRRWGWIVALIALAAWITYGLTEYTSEATRFQGAGVVEPDPTTITFLVLPGLAMLGALLAPATIRWVRSNSSLA